MEGLAGGVLVLTTRFKEKTEELMRRLAEIVQSTISEPSPVTPVQLCLSSLQHRVNDCLTTEEWKQAALLVGTIKSLVQAGVLVELDMASLFGWVDRQCREHEGVDDSSIVKALFDFLFFMAGHTRQEMVVARLVARDLHSVLGDWIEDSTPTDHGEQYRIIAKGKTARAAGIMQVSLALFATAEKLLTELDWALGHLSQTVKTLNEETSSNELASVLAPFNQRLQGMLDLAGTFVQIIFGNDNIVDTMLKAVRMLPWCFFFFA